MDMKCERYKGVYSPLAAPCGFRDHFRNADRGGDGHWSACAGDMHGRLEKSESNAGNERAAAAGGRRRV